MMSKLLPWLLALCLLPVAAFGEGIPVELLIPQGYTLGTPLPVYGAAGGDYCLSVDPAWFSERPAISDETKFNGLVNVRRIVYDDGTVIVACEDHLEYGPPYNETQINPYELAYMAGAWAEEGLPLHETLGDLALGDVKASVQSLLNRLCIGDWACDAALDLDAQRIRTESAAYIAKHRSLYGSDAMKAAEGVCQSAGEADACYWLHWRFRLGGLPVYRDYTWFEATALVGREGLRWISVTASLRPAGIEASPAKLLIPEEAAGRLEAEMKRSKLGGEMNHAIRMALIYSAAKGDSALVPAWHIIYQDDQAAAQGYECTAVFSAVDGTMLQSMFQ